MCCRRLDRRKSFSCMTSKPIWRPSSKPRRWWRRNWKKPISPTYGRPWSTPSRSAIAWAGSWPIWNRRSRSRRGKRRGSRRAGFYQRVYLRMEAYISRVIESLGLDAKGKRRKLEGKTVTFSLHGCDKRVGRTNESAVPSRYKRVTLTLPVDLWEQVIDALDLDLGNSGRSDPECVGGVHCA